LQNDVTVLLANKQEMNAGKITQMRLILGGENTITLKDSSSFDLKVPSGMQTGIKLNINEEIRNDYDLAVLIDFDAEKSIVETGLNTYLLQPVIDVKSVTQTEIK
jgi:hypothetical protein